MTSESGMSIGNVFETAYGGFAITYGFMVKSVGSSGNISYQHYLKKVTGNTSKSIILPRFEIPRHDFRQFGYFLY